MSLNPSTRHTLLQKALYLSDEDAWAKLIAVYKPLVAHILMKYNFQHHDIEDVSQRVFIKFTQKLSSYDPEKGRFRHWLSRVIKNEALNLLRSRASLKESLNVPGNNDVEVLERLSGSDEHNKMFDEEWEKFLYSRAWENVKGGFSQKAQRVFELFVQGESAHDIGRELSLEDTSIRNFKSRIKHSMLKEVRRLEQELDDGSERIGEFTK